MPSVQLKKGEFFERARARFYDLTFAAVAPKIEKIIEVAWKIIPSTTTVRAPTGLDAASATLNSLCRLNGSKPAAPGGKTTEKFPSELAHSAHQRLEPQ